MSLTCHVHIAKISVTSPIVINMPARELLAGETENSFVERCEHLNNKNNVCKQVSSLYVCLQIYSITWFQTVVFSLQEYRGMPSEFS